MLVASRSALEESLYTLYNSELSSFGKVVVVRFRDVADLQGTPRWVVVGDVIGVGFVSNAQARVAGVPGGKLPAGDTLPRYSETRASAVASA